MDPPVSISTEREREREIGKMREKEREEELGSRRRRTFSPLAAVCISNRFGAEYISKIPSRSRRLRFYLSNGSFITRSANDRSFCYFTRASLESPSRGGSIFHTIEKVRSCGARARTRHRVLAGLGEYRGERASEEQKIRKLRWSYVLHAITIPLRQRGTFKSVPLFAGPNNRRSRRFSGMHAAFQTVTFETADFAIHTSNGQKGFREFRQRGEEGRGHRGSEEHTGWKSSKRAL